MERLKVTDKADGRLAGWGLAALGAVLVAVAATGVRGATQLADQLSFGMSGGIGGVLSALVGAMLVVRARLREEWNALDELERLAETNGTVAAQPIGGFSTGNPPLRRWLRCQSDRLVGWALVVAGVGLYLVAIPVVSDSLYVPEQISFVISGGIVGLFLVATGCGVVVLADLRDQDAKLDRLDAPRDCARHAGGCRILPTASGVTLGGAVVLAAWRMASTTVRTDEALSALTAATAGLGLLLVVLGATGSTIRRPMADRIARLAQSLRADASAGADSEIELEDGVAVFTAPGLRRFHRQSCPALVLAGVGLQPVEDRDPRLEPCELCDAEV